MHATDMSLISTDMPLLNLCQNCGGTRIILDDNTGEKICSECGLVVVDQTLSKAPEWRVFNSREKSVRPRASPTQSLINEIGYNTGFQTYSDHSGRKLDSKTRSKMYRLRKHDRRSKLDGRVKNLSMATNILNRLADDLHIPDSVRLRAARIYRLSLGKDLIKGRSIAGFVAASVYAACREAEIPRSLQEISHSSLEDMKDISRVYRLLLRKLDLQMPVDYPMKFIPRIAEELDIDRETDRLSIKLLQKAKEEKVLVGKDPRGMAAAALYMACKMNDVRKTQKEIACVAGTTEVTLRNRYKDLDKITYSDDPGIDYLLKTPQGS